MNLPKKVTKTLYVHVGLGRYVNGEISVSDYKPDSWGDGFERTTISKFDIDIDLPEKFDAEGAMVEILTAQKSKLEADHYMAVKKIDDEIAQLLALTNKDAE